MSLRVPKIVWLIPERLSQKSKDLNDLMGLFLNVASILIVRISFTLNVLSFNCDFNWNFVHIIVGENILSLSRNIYQ